MESLAHDLATWASASLLAEGGPTIDTQYIVQIVSRVVHVLSAIILVGGLFYIRTVLAPGGADKCFGERRGVWARWVGICTVLLLGSGVYNLIAIIRQTRADGSQLQPMYHMLFGVKFLLALLVMFVAALLAGKTEAAQRFRSQIGRWSNIGWLAAIAIVVIAAVLKTLH